MPQTITVNGKALHYTATVGTITLKSKDDKLTGVVMYTDVQAHAEPLGWLRPETSLSGQV